MTAAVGGGLVAPTQPPLFKQLQQALTSPDQSHQFGRQLDGGRTGGVG